jgi:hypothetical protein
MDGEGGMYGGQERCIQGLVGRPQRDTTFRTKAYVEG